MGLASELSLKEGFHSVLHEALLSIYYTASRMKKKGDEFFRQYGLTDVQYNLMSLLWFEGNESGGLTQVELSRMMLVNRANITSLIDRMEKSQLVERISTPEDRRYNRVRLTPGGKKKFSKVEQIYAEEVDRIMGVLSEKEQMSLIQLLEKIRRNLE